MKIIYPHNQRFFLRRAHDILVMKTCHALASQGHDVYLIMGETCADTSELTRYYGLEPHPGLKFIQVPILRRQNWPRISWHGVFNFFCFRQLQKLIEEIAPDVIYLSEIKLGNSLLKKFKKLSVPVVYEVHGITGKNYVEPREIEGEVFNRCDELITTTKSLRDVIRKLYPAAAPVSCVPLATEVSEVSGFKVPEVGASWRLCYVGQLYPLQGVDLLIRAVSLLRGRVQLDVYGGKPEHIDALQQLTNDLDIKNQVVLHGFVPPHEVLKKAADAHICVIPCRSEKKMSFVAHTKLYEYLALGRPVVATDLPSIREEVDDKRNCLLFEAGNVEALAGAISTIMEDRTLAEKLAREARLAANQYTWPARATRLGEVFAKVKARSADK